MNFLGIVLLSVLSVVSANDPYYELVAKDVWLKGEALALLLLQEMSLSATGININIPIYIIGGNGKQAQEGAAMGVYLMKSYGFKVVALVYTDPTPRPGADAVGLAATQTMVDSITRLADIGKALGMVVTKTTGDMIASEVFFNLPASELTPYVIDCVFGIRYGSKEELIAPVGANLQLLIYGCAKGFYVIAVDIFSLRTENYTGLMTKGLTVPEGAILHPKVFISMQDITTQYTNLSKEIATLELPNVTHLLLGWESADFETDVFKLWISLPYTPKRIVKIPTPVEIVSFLQDNRFSNVERNGKYVNLVGLLVTYPLAQVV